MPRVVSIYLPTWATDVHRRTLGHQAPGVEMPLIMAGREGSRRVIVAADAAARAVGLRVGMTVAKAQALVKDVIVEEHRPDFDRRELERLALWFLGNYAPIVAIDPPDGVVIDTTGADHLHGNELLMVSGMVNRLHAMGIAARAAVADSWGAAHAIARHGREAVAVVPEGDVAASILDLSILALRLDADIVSSLRTLGFERIRDLETTPRAPLALRFGPQIGRRLDQALCRVPEPIDPIRPPDAIEVRRAFAEPISAAETIARYVGKLVRAICALLEEQGVGVRRLDLICQRVDSGIQVVRAGTAKPVRDVARLTRLLCDRIETVDPGFGIEILLLSASRVEPLDAVQTASSLIEEPEADVGGLVDVIANRGHRVYRIAAVESDVPERSFMLVPPLADDDEIGWPAHWPRPSRLLLQAEPIQCIAPLPDHPPVRFTWRGIRHVVKRADGPERVHGEWWKRDKELLAVRDYFSVENEAGERFWIYRQGDGEHGDSGSGNWFLQGIFG
ncbi:MAG: DNA polymerase Y family protein [Rhizobiaceae bacterium]|nr:DNA polymerase Y family protein [Rhizobiaceae bacterium]